MLQERDHLGVCGYQYDIVRSYSVPPTPLQIGCIVLDFGPQRKMCWREIRARQKCAAHNMILRFWDRSIPSPQSLTVDFI
jgi:hypothetical protein